MFFYMYTRVVPHDKLIDTNTFQIICFNKDGYQYSPIRFPIITNMQQGQGNEKYDWPIDILIFLKPVI